MKLQENINFMNNVTTTFLGEQITKIKVIDLDESYNFYVHNIFSKSYLVF